MSNQPTHLFAYLKATFAVLVWGASFIATKIALRDISPMTIIWLRFGIGVAILGVLVLARKEFSFVSMKDLGYLSLLGFIGITFHQWLQANGLITAKATTTAWLVATIPVFIALLGRLVLRERLGWIRMGGILSAAGGVLLVVSQGDLYSVLQLHLGTRGDALVLLSAPNWAVFSVLSRKGLRKFAATNMMLYVMGTGWLLSSFLFFSNGGFSELQLLTGNGWWSIGFLGIFCSGLAYVFWYDALKDLPASKVGSLLYLEPLVAVIVARVFLEEPLLLAAFLGGCLILLGVWLVNRSSQAQFPPD